MPEKDREEISQIRQKARKNNEPSKEGYSISSLPSLNEQKRSSNKSNGTIPNFYDHRNALKKQSLS